jgi:uncharacterized protein Yka (UPF0111/DUF47 family)
MIEQLIAKVFEARNVTHLEHWRTKSYAVHKALGNFYEDVIDLLDDLVECYQGNFGIIGKVPDVEQSHNGNCIECLNDQVSWIAKHRSQIAQEVDALENIVDEITGLYLKTLYKLENLS